MPADDLQMTAPFLSLSYITMGYTKILPFGMLHINWIQNEGWSRTP